MYNFIKFSKYLFKKSGCRRKKLIRIGGVGICVLSPTSGSSGVIINNRFVSRGSMDEIPLPKCHHKETAGDAIIFIKK